MNLFKQSKPKLSSYLKLLLFFLFHLQVHHHTEVRYEVWAWKPTFSDKTLKNDHMKLPWVDKVMSSWRRKRITPSLLHDSKQINKKRCFCYFSIFNEIKLIISNVHNFSIRSHAEPRFVYQRLLTSKNLTETLALHSWRCWCFQKIEPIPKRPMKWPMLKTHWPPL